MEEDRFAISKSRQFGQLRPGTKNHFLERGWLGRGPRIFQILLPKSVAHRSQQKSGACKYEEQAGLAAHKRGTLKSCAEPKPTRSSELDSPACGARPKMDGM